MIFGSVCSGIEAASVAWHPLGWRAAFLSEIEAFPRSVLTHHFPDVPLHGDFTTIEAGQYDAINLLVGGTPCQSFSVAGLRGGLADDRGNLALEYLRLADRLRPRWLVWENVPGVLSSNGGRDFGAILGGMGELGYGFAYRVLDAQHFGVPQRRRRVFVVGYLGDWRRAAAVLFERHSLQGHTPPRREAREIVAALTADGVGTCGADDNQGQAGHLLAASTGNVAHCLNAGGMGRQDFETETLIAHALRGEGFDASEDGTGRGTPLVATGYRTSGNWGAYETGDGVDALTTGTDRSSHLLTIPIDMRQASRGATMTNNRREGSSGGAPGTGIGEPGDPAPTVSTSHVAAVAFDLRGREGGAQFEGPHDSANIRAASGGSSRSYVLGSSPEAMYGVTHADAAQTNAIKALRTLLHEAGEEAFTEWGLGVLAAFWPAEILRPEVHGRGVRCATLPKRGLVNVALSRSQAGASWTVQDLWEAGCDGRSPHRWQPHEQCARELGAYLSKLPHSPSPAQRIMHDLWSAGEGSGLLREALSALQEARRSACGEGQPARAGTAVRRLTVEECEALQGFPRGYTLVPHRGKPAADGNRYKALGNSMAVPVMRWLGERIASVDIIPSADQRSQARLAEAHTRHAQASDAQPHDLLET